MDELIGGGFRKNTVNIVHGGIGVGKTTFGIQYALYGLNRGEKAIYISFEMTEQQIVRDINQLGFKEIEDHIRTGDLKIIHIYGEDLMYPSLDLSKIIEESLSEAQHHRIVIDPLTYYSMYLDNEKRKSLSSIFQNLRKNGTSVIAFEDTNQVETGNYSSTMPMYLADSVLHLHYLGYGELFDRTIRVVKHRGSKHGDGLYPYKIENGLGIVIEASERDIDKVTPTSEFDGQFKTAINDARKIEVVGDKLAKRLELLRKNWTHNINPEYILKMVLNNEKK